MPLSEFTLIERFFARRANRLRAQSLNTHDAIPLGIGDDCALIAPAAGEMLAISTDMLVEGRHFFADVDPHALGHKALAVNLSDLAAMGAKPRAFTLALALPTPDETWLSALSDGLFELAERFDCALIGGDTTCGPLNICITVFGEAPLRAALRRDTACVGDDIWVSGTLGDARAALGMLRGEWSIDPTDAPHVRRALERPEPRIALGLALRGVAHAALDISDGLAGDLMHILERSRLNATVNVDALPRSSALRKLPAKVQLQCAAAGGDDYELCFTAPVTARDTLNDISTRVKTPLTRIGALHALHPRTAASNMINDASASDTPAIRWHRASSDAPLSLPLHGFDHFHHAD